MPENEPNKPDTTIIGTPSPEDTSSNRLLIRIGSHAFGATLLSNPAARAFKARLPLSLSMKELNGNEKFVDLSGNLPTNATNPGTIQTGDLMLYGSNTLVLFYESFRTSYAYTRLGKIDNPAGLVAALGSGTITVSFQIE